MKAFLILWFALTLLAQAGAPPFVLAQWSAEKGEWNQAISHYSSALEYEGPSASVYYNLGYCQQQVGDVGRAVLAYERCLALSPRAADARNNLTKLREETSLPTTRTLANGSPMFSAWLSRGEWCVVFFVASALLISSFWWAWFASRRHVRILLFAASVVGCALMALAAWIIGERQCEDRLAVVLAADQSLQLSPFPTSEKLTSCPPGSVVSIAREHADYVFAELTPGNTRGWLRKDSVEKMVSP
jgi:tetratricopeptide (TPR) repeat protein